jgi:hypothetical protein
LGQAFAWWEGPYDVLRFAYQKLNMGPEAEAAAAKHAAAAASKGHPKPPVVAGLQSAALFLSSSSGKKVRDNVLLQVLQALAMYRYMKSEKDGSAFDQLQL